MNEITLLLIYASIIVAVLSTEITEYMKSASLLAGYGLLTALITILEGEIIGGIVNLVIVGGIIPYLIIRTTKSLEIDHEKEKFTGKMTLVTVLLVSLGLVSSLLFVTTQYDWVVAVSATLAFVGVFCMVTKGNLIKIVVGFTLFDSALHLLLSLYSVQFELPLDLAVITLATTSGLLLAVDIMILYLAKKTYTKLGTLDSWSLGRLKG